MVIKTEPIKMLTYRKLINFSATLKIVITKTVVTKQTSFKLILNQFFVRNLYCMNCEKDYVILITLKKHNKKYHTNKIQAQA